MFRLVSLEGHLLERGDDDLVEMCDLRAGLLPQRAKNQVATKVCQRKHCTKCLRLQLKDLAGGRILFSTTFWTYR